MAKAAKKQEQVSPEESSQKALLRKLDSLEKVHAASVESQAKFNRRIADDIAAITEAIRALTASPRLAKAAAEDARDEANRQLAPAHQAELLSTLQRRLEQTPAHYERPEGIIFADVRRALEANPMAMWSLVRMEITGGEPDIAVVEDDAFIFADCSAESPAGRRNCVYDKAAEKIASDLEGNAVHGAEALGVEMWSPEFYHQMQSSGQFDCGTWSWLKTDAVTRSDGYANRGSRDGDHVVVDNRFDAFRHGDNGAWRGVLRVQKA